jgi:glycosyltransferase involved in cell wall biosynthesis
MKFSVLMSIYKNDDPCFLIEALESLKSQTLLANDIVIVRDGPVPFEINNVIESFSNVLPIQYIKLDKNVGLGQALNQGLTYVKNDWVFRMDSDDICLSERFELQVKAIKSNPSLNVVGGWIEEFVLKPGDTKSFRKVPLTHQNITLALRSFSPFNHVTVAFNKNKVIASGSYIGGKDFQEDYYLWLRMAVAKSHFLNIPHVLVNVRAGDDMLGRRAGWRYFKNELLVATYGLKNSVIPIHIYLRNVILKFFTRMSPLFIRKSIYKLARIHINKPKP